MATNNTLTVLVVEDNRAIQANIADYFTMQGAVVDFALNGRQGAELALQHYYDVIVLDLTLPQLDGLDVSTQPQYFQGIDTLVLPLDGKSHQLRWEFRSVIGSAADSATATATATTIEDNTMSTIMTLTVVNEKNTIDIDDNNNAEGDDEELVPMLLHATEAKHCMSEGHSDD